MPRRMIEASTHPFGSSCTRPPIRPEKFEVDVRSCLRLGYSQILYQFAIHARFAPDRNLGREIRSRHSSNQDEKAGVQNAAQVPPPRQPNPAWRGIHVAPSRLLRDLPMAFPCRADPAIRE